MKRNILFAFIFAFLVFLNCNFNNPPAIIFNIDYDYVIGKGYDVSTVKATLTHQTSGTIETVGCWIDHENRTARGSTPELMAGTWAIIIEIADAFGVIATGTGVVTLAAGQEADAAMTIPSNSEGAVIRINWSEISTVELMGEWLFNENADDTSRYANSGIVYGATLVPDRFGVENRAYSFDGIDDYIRIIDPAMYHTPSFTVNFWANPDNGTSEKAIIYGEYSWGIYHNKGTVAPPENKIVYATDIVDMVGDDPFRLESIPVFANNTYFMYTITFDCISRISNIYKNSVLVTTSPTKTLFLDFNNSGDMLIGASALASSFFKGIIDDIRIYNRALTDTEVTTLYAEGGWPGL